MVLSVSALIIQLTAILAYHGDNDDNKNLQFIRAFYDLSKLDSKTSTLLFPLVVFGLINNSQQQENIGKIFITPGHHIDHHETRDSKYAAPLFNIDYFFSSFKKYIKN